MGVSSPGVEHPYQNLDSAVKPTSYEKFNAFSENEGLQPVRALAFDEESTRLLSVYKKIWQEDETTQATQSAMRTGSFVASSNDESDFRSQVSELPELGRTSLNE